ncbi:cytochrome b6-f complex iron-sulfur subunit [Anthocerotibacter panamensis]|uniref:cytochrome b6-f complex iron-sulfur subunit n=1 Tax=Anthocerotibacter panamensis TaxID=2857077 RepID=UPI001C404568|nr:cytochrome b6-f complex iron-sulfur subunit [Anthocerotibacter panamensis]
MTEPAGAIALSRRRLLTYLTGSTLTAATAASLYPVARFFLPPEDALGVPAQDQYGKDIRVRPLLSKMDCSTSAATRVWVQSAQVIHDGSAMYLVVKDCRVARYALSAICPHLGCVVPWNPESGVFQCPCHSSQFDQDGGLLRGPAPRPLALLRVTIQDDRVFLSPWTEADFRCTPLYCDQEPWWER